MTDESRHLRAALQAALKENEALKLELERLRGRLRELERPATPAVDVYDLDVLKQDAACPWTGWPAHD